MNVCTSKCNFRTETANMVTTIKITCDGVFIQTNSNRIHTTDERIVTDSSINVINGTNRNHHHRRHRLGNSHAIVDAPNKAPFIGITKRSISVHNIDAAPQSLPNLPIANEQPALVSPQLVKTLSRIKKTTLPVATEAVEALETDASPNEIVINSLSTSTDALSSLSAARSIHRVIRVDRNGKSIQRATPITSCTRQWDGSTVVNKMKNGTASTGAVVRRRNTFKSYLIECKENIVRRLSSPTPLIVG